MIRYFKLTVDNELIVESGNDILRLLQEAVGGYIKVAPQNEYMLIPKKWVLVANEEGILIDEPRVNLLTSMIYGVAEHGQPLVGTVCIVCSDGEQFVDPDDISFQKMKKWLEAMRDLTQGFIKEHGPSGLVPDLEIKIFDWE